MTLVQVWKRTLLPSRACQLGFGTWLMLSYLWVQSSRVLGCSVAVLHARAGSVVVEERCSYNSMSAFLQIYF